MKFGHSSRSNMRKRENKNPHLEIIRVFCRSLSINATWQPVSIFVPYFKVMVYKHLVKLSCVLLGNRDLFSTLSSVCVGLEEVRKSSDVRGRCFGLDEEREQGATGGRQVWNTLASLRPTASSKSLWPAATRTLTATLNAPSSIQQSWA